MMFPSPHLGILFLWMVFYHGKIRINCVSVPSFGDSFFMEVADNVLMRLAAGFRPLIRDNVGILQNTQKV